MDWLLNWKQTVNSQLAIGLLKHLQNNSELNKKIYLLWAPPLWSLIQKNSNSQIKLIAQNFSFYSFAQYFQKIHQNINYPWFNGVLLNHSERSETKVQKQQLCNLMLQHHKLVFYCIGAQLLLTKPIDDLKSQLIFELTVFQKTIWKPGLQIVLLFEPLLYNLRQTLVVNHYQIINQLLKWLMQFEFNLFRQSVLVMYGGGINTENYHLLKSTGFCIGVASLKWEHLLPCIS